MIATNLSTGTWVSLNERCPLRCTVEGSDLAHVLIGDEDHSVELLLNAKGMRRLAAASSQAVIDMDTLFEQEDATCAAANPAGGAVQNGATS